MGRTISTMLAFTELSGMLEANPDEIRPHEPIDGVIYVSPHPYNTHQWVVGDVGGRLHSHQQEHGGMTLLGGGVYYDEYNFVEPDVLHVRPEHLDRPRGTPRPRLIWPSRSRPTRRVSVTSARSERSTSALGSRSTGSSTCTTRWSSCTAAIQASASRCAWGRTRR